MAECLECGGELPEGAHNCPGCGAPVVTTQSGAAPVVSSPTLSQTAGHGKAKKRFPRGAVVAIIAGCVTVALIVLMVVLLAVSVVDIFKKPADVANAYIKALSSGNLDTAWDYLSAGARTEKDRATFESDVRGLGGRIRKWNARSILIRDHKAQVTLDVEFNSGEEATVYVYLVKENGEWRVRSAAETPVPGFEENTGV